MKKAIVIGAGLGGLAAAIKLAHAGCKVTVLEQQATVGGKLQRLQRDGYLFDRGPSTITMRHIFDSLFRSVGRSLEDYVTLYRLDSGSRNLFCDGSIVDAYSDPKAMEDQLAVFSPRDAANYRSFMEESASLYRLAEEQFLNNLLIGWSDKLRPGLVKGFLKARPFTSLNGLLRRYFSHPHTLAMFGRYATYVGSDPAKAPAIFGMLAHVELELGVYAAKGGNYKIAEAFGKLAKELGAEIRLSERVHSIAVKGGKVTGVCTSNGDYDADLVVAGGDVLSIHQELLAAANRPSMSDARIEGYEPSLSGFAMMAGVRRTFSGLRHHTVFYPPLYGDEFADIFGRLTAPSDPAIYICHSGYSEPGMAPPGSSNLFILANAPYLSERWNWEERGEEYASFLLSKLEERGLGGLTASTEFAETYSPRDLQAGTSAYRGAIYGISSNTPRQTFNRPSNRGDAEGLWFVGGTTHPGGGTPMVTLSGMLVADRILKSGNHSI
ncbi:phytoene desaturase family protein [Paenibacillus sp. CAU 1782]